jgi:murein DD-endopeptidase MepM/ murein hydrolase activator NlpD
MRAEGHDMTDSQPGSGEGKAAAPPVDLPLWAKLWQDLTGRNPHAPVFRYARHVFVLATVIGFAVVAKSSLWSWLPAQIMFDSPTAEPTLNPTPIPSSPFSAILGDENSFRVLTRLVNGHTDFPAKLRTEVEVYSVQKGDTLFAIAAKYNIKPESILWSNYNILKDNPDFLAPGQSLYILPVDGMYYEWQEGDRLDIIAAKYGVSPDEIILWPGNNLSPNIDLINPDILRGTMLVLPGGHREFQIHQLQIPVLRRTDNTKWAYGGTGACQGPFASSVVGTGNWAWPTDSHWVGGTNYTDYHPAIDLYATMGANIYAADSGVVVYSGWNTWGYGNLTVIDHGNGWQTVYGHQSVILYGCGANVQRGAIIGQAGSTGNSTGPHLHFEMIINGAHVNPLNYLK